MCYVELTTYMPIRNFKRCVSFATLKGDGQMATMWGMYLGLEMAWRKHIPQLIVESDYKILIDLVTENCKFSGSVPILVQRIQKLLALDWRVQIHHTLRKGNRCADWLSTFNFSLDSFNCIIMENPSVSFVDFFFMTYLTLLCLEMFG